MLETLLERWGDGVVLALAGLTTGLIFGVAAQHSRFCLRAATAEVAEAHPADRMAIWLIAFFSALIATQLAVLAGILDVSSARQLAATGSLSGAIIGGLLFGSGMILARGCASRLLVLSGTGNLRALIAGLVVTLVAQASYRGVLAPAREWVAGLWTITGGIDRDLMVIFGLSRTAVILIGLAGLGLGMVMAFRHSVAVSRTIAGVFVGLAVALGWWLTWMIASTSFEVVPISSVTFTGPSTDTLMALVAERSMALNFGIGLVPGVFLGSALMAAIAGEWKIQRFGADTPMERYLVGAVMMGFGAMLAGGCAVGAGVSGGAILSLTAWIAVAAMWAGALLTIFVSNGFQTSATPA
ncbi:YeeE/YedE family protein [Silicimonas sp. MF1-12-2]|uniref:YeeE/YedE family protein n=1 Tax=Silicimonas sp. MF1-12-2 TaxID=3384793 RepID=UPI0039B6539E